MPIREKTSKEGAEKLNPRLKEILERHKGQGGALIPVLQEAQGALGYLSQETLQAIALNLNIPASQVYGVVTFYTQFRLKPVGHHLIRVCHGTACHVSGAEAIGEALKEELQVEDGETTADGKYTLDSVACLGCCSLAPVIMVDEEAYGRLTPEAARKIVRNG